MPDCDGNDDELILHLVLSLGAVLIAPFVSFTLLKPEKSELRLLLEAKEQSFSWTCYNEFDFDAIECLCNKILKMDTDLMTFTNELKPQLCFVCHRGWLKKNMKNDSEIRFILVERMAIIHPPHLESQPQYLFPLWKRPCFTVGKNGVRFDLGRKRSVDVFFESEDVRDEYFGVIAIAAKKAPSESVPLRKKLEILVRLSKTPFEARVASHFAFAQRLWAATVGKEHEGEELPSSGESERWKELGCSTTSLALDLKVCNMLGLVAMVYLAENYPSDLDEMLKAQAAAADGMSYAVFPNVARIAFMFFSLLNLGKKQSTWYPSFVTYPMWNYDSEAYELLVCIGLRLFNKKWESSSGARNPTQCMNDLVADLSDTLSRPSSDGVPYVFNMFRVLLSRKAPGERSYDLPEKEEPAVARRRAASSVSSINRVASEALDAWSFTQREFLSIYMSSEPSRQTTMMTTPFSVLLDNRGLMAKRAERKRLEIKWEAVKGARNEFKDKFHCLICRRRKRSVVVLPCACLSLCSPCYTEGMVCPMCKSYVLGFIEAVFDDDSLKTLR